MKFNLILINNQLLKMKSDKLFPLCITLFILYFFHLSSQQTVKTLNLYEGTAIYFIFITYSYYTIATKPIKNFTMPCPTTMHYTIFLDSTIN